MESSCATQPALMSFHSCSIVLGYYFCDLLWPSWLGEMLSVGDETEILPVHIWLECKHCRKRKKYFVNTESKIGVIIESGIQICLRERWKSLTKLWLNKTPELIINFLIYIFVFYKFLYVTKISWYHLDVKLKGSLYFCSFSCVAFFSYILALPHQTMHSHPHFEPDCRGHEEWGEPFVVAADGEGPDSRLYRGYVWGGSPACDPGCRCHCRLLL